MKKKLPLLISKEIYIFPGFSSQINVGRERSVATINAANKDYNNQVLMVSEINTKEKATLSNIYKIGILCDIKIIKKLTNSFLIELKSIERVKINKFDNINNIIYGNFSKLKDRKLTKPETEKLNTLVLNFVKKIDKKINSDVKAKFLTKKAITEFLYTILQNYPENRNNFKQKSLETQSLLERLNIIFEYVNFEPLKNINFSKIIDQNINRRLNDRLSSQQKEFILREKMKAISEELGEMNPQVKEIDGYFKRLKTEPFPKNIKEKLFFELRRFQSLPSTSGEANLLKSYIDWVINLPWYQKTEEAVDLKKAINILNDSHFGLKKAKERIIEHLAANIFSKKFTGQIICLIGPPGVGKTSLGISIAEAMKRKYARIALGGVKDESEIRGHRRTYLGAMPGKIIQALKKVQTINPVILIDEIDKLSSDFRGDPASAMLEVLDPEQNKGFVDNYIEEPYDLSKVMFIATANSYEGIPVALWDRMEVVWLSSYTEIEKLAIAKSYLLNKILNNLKLNKEQLIFSDQAIMEIIKYYTRESGVRELQRLITKICRKVIVKILAKKTYQKNLDAKHIKSFLDERIYEFTNKNKKHTIGVVTGLAYTQYGGDILPIETTKFQGSGKLILTGKLGEVMQESANISFDYIKSNAKYFRIDFNHFKDFDFHIHVPGGAIPKDGPSAGITITTALLSLLKNESISNEVAMTGEITLRGKVLPIGGLKEKAISAVRSGIKTIYIPKDNKNDVKNLPKEIQEKLKIILVDQYEDVFKKLFIQFV